MKSLGDLIDEVIANREIEMRPWLRILVYGVEDGALTSEALLIPSAKCGMQ
jgi:hypothetical protein